MHAYLGHMVQSEYSFLLCVQVGCSGTLMYPLCQRHYYYTIVLCLQTTGITHVVLKKK